MYSKLVCIWLLILSVQVAPAQYASTFENITIAQGLPSDYVYTCTEDANGYLWAATNKGLCRYNGKLWELWDVSKGLPGNFVLQLIADNHKGLWLQIAEKGVYYCNTDDMRFTLVDTATTAKLYTSLQDDRIFIVTDKVVITAVSKGNKINTTTTTIETALAEKKFPFTHLNFINGNNTTSKKNILQRNSFTGNKINFTTNYIASHNDIFFIDHNEIKKINATIPFKNKLGNISIAQTNEFCYIANTNEGIVELDTFGNSTFFGKQHGMNNLAIQSLYVSKDGILYATTLGGGINVLYNTKRHKISIQNGPVKDIQFSSTDFLGIDKSNLLAYNQSTKQQYKIALPYQPIALCAYNNELVIASAQQLFFYNYSNGKLLLKKSIPINVTISSLLYTNQQLYCSTYGKGIGIVSTNGIEFPQTSFPFLFIEKIIPFKNELIALSNESGCFTTTASLQVVHHFTTKNGLLSNSIKSAAQQADTIWLGGNGGIHKIVANKVVKTYTEKDGLQGNTVLALGLQYNMIFVIVSEKRIQQLFNNKIIPVANNALLLTDDYMATTALVDEKLSEVVIGDNSNFQVLDLTEFQPSAVVPMPKIERILVGNSTIDTSSSVTLPYSFKKITFKLSPLSDLIFNRTDIYYKLDDEAWQKVNDTLTISFTNLRAGSYKLYIKSTNNYGIESDTVLLKSFTVKQPWWLQWWFIALCIIGGAIILYGIVRYLARQKLKKQLQEIKVQQQLEDERQRISRDLHDNMGAYTSALIANVQKIKKTLPDEASVNQMQQNAESVLAALRETIWVLNNKEISLQELNDQFKNYIFKLLRNFEDINFHCVDEAQTTKIFSAATALHLNKMLQECIQNIIKHSGAKNIYYNLIVTDTINFTISDDGKGFDTNTISYGNGLGNLQWRAKEINAQISITSIDQKGTHISIRI